MTKHGEQFRGRAQPCDTDNTARTRHYAIEGIYCFGDKRGGDVVGLVAHCKGIARKTPPK